MRVIRSKAPLRISFAGGGTDVPPYPSQEGGCVLSTTINKFAYVSLIPRQDKNINISSLDFDIMAKYNVDQEVIYDGQLDLVKSVLKNMDICQGLDMYIHSDAPPGSGLGSSSTMAVALVGAIKHWLQLPMTDYEVSEKAYFVERKDLKIDGGMQDQYAASFGGVSFIDFYGENDVVVNPLRINKTIINELEYSLLLCYTGGTRLSAKIIEDQVKKYNDKEKKSVKALRELKQITFDMKDALLRGNLDNFGDLLHQGWENKKKLSGKISNPNIDGLYHTARKAGALGGKLLGAGGGGYLLIYCPFNRRHIVARKLEDMGGQIVDFQFDKYGLQTWEATSEVVTEDEDKTMSEIAATFEQ